GHVLSPPPYQPLVDLPPVRHQEQDVNGRPQGLTVYKEHLQNPGSTQTKPENRLKSLEKPMK
ncbi:MAG: hypothetical protein QXU44_12105, partial [Candidatus Caldarchaeum sp.]